MGAFPAFVLITGLYFSGIVFAQISDYKGFKYDEPLFLKNPKQKSMSYTRKLTS
jgi:hypothetical protein